MRISKTPPPTTLDFASGDEVSLGYQYIVSREISSFSTGSAVFVRAGGVWAFPPFPTVPAGWELIMRHRAVMRHPTGGSSAECLIRNFSGGETDVTNSLVRMTQTQPVGSFKHAVSAIMRPTDANPIVGDGVTTFSYYGRRDEAGTIDLIDSFLQFFARKL